MTDISISLPLCSGCKTCTEVCPYFILKTDESTKKPAVDHQLISRCCHCGHCEAVCPEGAITVMYTGAGPVPGTPEYHPVSPVQIGQHLMMRRSIRDYTPEPVPEETLRQILEIVRYAPTGMNGQPVHWLVMRDPAEIRNLAGTIIEWGRDVVKNQPGHPLAPILPMVIDAWDQGADPVCHHAPCLVIAHGPHDNPNVFIDAVIAMTHLDIVAPSFGLGTCWAGFVQIAAATSPAVARSLRLPEGHRAQCAMLAGYPEFRFRRIPKRDDLKVTWR